MAKKIVALALLTLSSIAASASEIQVPADHATIQAAINASQNGDSVIVAPGIYVENIQFGGKSIVLTSHYLNTQDPRTINDTIIDGSQPTDTANGSTVLIDDTDETSALIGFTIRGGSGTAFRPNSGTIREGGGVLLTNSMATVSNNLIIDNSVDREPGINDAGGGGISAWYSTPTITNNVIADNYGWYVGGLVTNFCEGTVSNNIIFRNNSTGTYGGGAGLFIYGGQLTVFVNNNTIIDNDASTGGSIAVLQGRLVGRNNIIANKGLEISLQSAATVDLSYSLVEGWYEGTGNIDMDPELSRTQLLLSAVSPCIDAGDPEADFDDPENPEISGLAMWPARGTIRSDLGAYGGPQANLAAIAHFSTQGDVTHYPSSEEVGAAVSE